MDRPKIKRRSKKTKPVTTKEKFLAGLGVGAGLIGGFAGGGARQSRPNPIVSTQSANTQSSGVGNKVKNLANEYLGVPTAKAYAESMSADKGSGETGGGGGYYDPFGGDLSVGGGVSYVDPIDLSGYNNENFELPDNANYSGSNAIDGTPLYVVPDTYDPTGVTHIDDKGNIYEYNSATNQWTLSGQNFTEEQKFENQVNDYGERYGLTIEFDPQSKTYKITSHGTEGDQSYTVDEAGMRQMINDNDSQTQNMTPNQDGISFHPNGSGDAYVKDPKTDNYVKVPEGKSPAEFLVELSKNDPPTTLPADTKGWTPNGDGSYRLGNSEVSYVKNPITGEYVLVPDGKTADEVLASLVNLPDLIPPPVNFNSPPGLGNLPNIQLTAQDANQFARQGSFDGMTAGEIAKYLSDHGLNAIAASNGSVFITTTNGVTGQNQTIELSQQVLGSVYEGEVRVSTGNGANVHQTFINGEWRETPQDGDTELDTAGGVHTWRNGGWSVSTTPTHTNGGNFSGFFYTFLGQAGVSIQTYDSGNTGGGGGMIINGITTPASIDTSGLYVVNDINNSLTGTVNLTVNGQSTPIQLSIIKDDGRIYDASGKEITNELSGLGVNVYSLRQAFLDAEANQNSNVGAPPAITLQAPPVNNPPPAITDETPYDVYAINSPTNQNVRALAAWVGTDADGNVINQVVFIIKDPSSGQMQAVDSQGQPIALSNVTVNAIVSRGQAGYLDTTVNNPPPVSPPANPITVDHTAYDTYDMGGNIHAAYLGTDTQGNVFNATVYVKKIYDVASGGDTYIYVRADGTPLTGVTQPSQPTLMAIYNGRIVNVNTQNPPAQTTYDIYAFSDGTLMAYYDSGDGTFRGNVYMVHGQFYDENGNNVAYKLSENLMGQMVAGNAKNLNNPAPASSLPAALRNLMNPQVGGGNVSIVGQVTMDINNSRKAMLMVNGRVIIVNVMQDGSIWGGDASDSSTNGQNITSKFNVVTAQAIYQLVMSAQVAS